MSEELTLIAAMDAHRAIGRGNGIPWHYPEDFAHFKRETLGKALVMGRATWESIGRPLPGRETVVLTRDPSWKPVGYEASVPVAHSLEEALAVARSLAPEVAVAGGAQVYAQALPLATHQVLTHLPLTVEGAGAFYPAFAEEEWEEARRVESAGLVYRWLLRR